MVMLMDFCDVCESVEFGFLDSATMTFQRPPIISDKDDVAIFKFLY